MVDVGGPCMCFRFVLIALERADLSRSRRASFTCRPYPYIEFYYLGLRRMEDVESFDYKRGVIPVLRRRAVCNTEIPKLRKTVAR